MVDRFRPQGLRLKRETLLFYYWQWHQLFISSMDPTTPKMLEIAFPRHKNSNISRGTMPLDPLWCFPSCTATPPLPSPAVSKILDRSNLYIYLNTPTQHTTLILYSSTVGFFSTLQAITRHVQLYNWTYVPCPGVGYSRTWGTAEHEVQLESVSATVATTHTHGKTHALLQHSTALISGLFRIM